MARVMPLVRGRVAGRREGWDEREVGLEARRVVAVRVAAPRADPLRGSDARRDVRVGALPALPFDLLRWVEERAFMEVERVLALVAPAPPWEEGLADLGLAAVPVGRLRDGLAEGLPVGPDPPLPCLAVPRPVATFAPC